MNMFKLVKSKIKYWLKSKWRQEGVNGAHMNINTVQNKHTNNFAWDCLILLTKTYA